MILKTASEAHDLLVLQRAEPFPPKAWEMLQRKGFNTRLTRDIETITDFTGQLADPIIIVDCGLQEGSHDFMRMFVDRTRVTEFPILVLGKDVDGLESELTQYFGLVTTLRLPCPPSDILDAINFLASSYRKGEPKVTATPSKPPAPPRRRLRRKERGEQESIPETPVVREAIEAPVAPEPTSEEKEAIDDATSLGHHLYGEFESVPTLLFQQLQSFKLLEKPLGGDEYPRQTRNRTSSVRELLPERPELHSTIEELSNGLGKWGSQHIARTAFLTSKLLEPLEISPEFRVAARAASMLFPIGLKGKGRVLLRRDYTGRGVLMLRKELCSLLKDSALQLATEHGLKVESALIARLGRMIGREEAVSDETASVVASAILAAELTDRICFQNGPWNFRAAYTLIKRIKSGKFREVHPAVLCCLVKILAESITANPAALTLPKSIRDNPELRERARQQREMEIAPHETRIEIDKLAPGMRLTKPLFAFDGRMVLDDDLMLDQDLIWRIWQLSAVRPLNAPVIIKKQDSEQNQSD